ncbi:hypothetical protein AB3S75_045757 [Citrus x aurantiifolia]
MSQTFLTKPSFVRFNILVVDDDSTSLSIVSAILKFWDYDVVTVTRPVEALATVRIQRDIDLVVTDLHMPEMNGIELQKEINEEFTHLPVMVMSSDDRESVIMKALASGVAFYILKPLNPDDLKNVWQYAMTYKKAKSISIDEIGSFELAGFSADKFSLDDIVSRSSVNERNKNQKDSKRKAPKKDKGKQTKQNATAPKKPKVAWTDSLHNRFLQAIRHIGLEKAVPKKILEFMNVPGLTRENVASHLQKYRIFLKRVAEQGAKAMGKNLALRSSFAAGHVSMMLQEAHEFSQIRDKQQQMRTSAFLPGYGSGVSALNGTTFGSIGFPSLGASSSNSVPQPGLMGNQANFPQSLFGNTRNPLYQANSAGTTCGSSGSNNMEANPLSRGGLATGLMNQMYQQKSQSRQNPYDNDNIGASSSKGFGTSGWSSSSNTSGLDQNMGTIRTNTYSNYAGIRLNDDGELIPAGQTSLINGNGLNGGYGLITGTSGIMANAAFGHLTPGASSSSSARFDNATYRIPLAFAGANEQENTSMLSHLSSQQQYGPGNNAQNDFTNFAPINNASANGNTAQPERFGEGIDLVDLLFDPSDYQFLFQQQGGEGAVNPNPGSGSGSHQAGLNLPINQSQNPDLSEAFAAGDNFLSPWIEPTLEQLLEIEDVSDPELSSNADPLNVYYPSFDQNANQGWDDEFINSLLRENPN